MRAWRRRDQFDSSKEIASWLVGFLVNVVRESVKKQRNITSFDSQLALANAVDTTRSVQDILSDNSLAIDMLGKLQTQDQALVKLKYWEDLTCAEIGQRLEMKENAVRTRLWRIDKKLKQLYGVTGEGQS
jgi:RNA polymerase sigma-70 factor (ECF subfamily)